MICKICKSLFDKKSERQVTCSRRCNAINHNKQRKFNCPKCKVCGLETRRVTGAKFCSRKCMGLGFSGVENPMWKGGIKKHSDGYVYIFVDGKYILEHRLIMANYLKRDLTKDEVIHHINGIKDDNRIENLELTTQSEHVFKEGHLNGKKYKVTITTVL